ncbi:MAG: ATP-binding protein [Desulfovibrio sp.]|uniref:ATP-binding protein n=1 Tax=Desulfovibrio sp. 7SRBS1 TaxID=3378064 RepID=UPI003B3F30D2
MDFTLRRLATNQTGYAQIIDLNDKLESFTGEKFHLDCSQLSWIDANMCSCLGAVIHKATAKTRISFVGLRDSVHKILCKNNFLPELCKTDPAWDSYQTTIKYHRYAPHEIQGFKDYTEQFFVDGARGLPHMTPKLLRRFRESLWEIFENAVAHSETKLGIYVCGQYFPKKDRLDFSISDLGIGFKQRILRSIGTDFSPELAIAWALQENNTTRNKVDGKPGGIGLKLIQKFLEINSGKMIIVSDQGYWEVNGSAVNYRLLTKPYPGTTVNIEINTADTKNYCLQEELIDPSTIF